MSSESPFLDIEGSLPTESSFSDCLGSSSSITAGLIEPGQHPREPDGPLLRVILLTGEPATPPAKNIQ